MRYCGIAVGAEFQHLCALEEVRAPEPPVRLRATFFEPGTCEEVVGGLRALGEVVVAVGAPQTALLEGERMRACDAELLRRGVPPQACLETGLALYDGLADLGIYAPAGAGGAGEEPPGGSAPPPEAPRAPEEPPAPSPADVEPPAPSPTDGEPGDPAAGRETVAAGEQEEAAVVAGELGPALEGPVEEGAFRTAAVFEVNVDGVFCALQGRRVPAKRHPLGILRRIEELVEDQVDDDGGELWHRRIEEIEAAAAALTAHRYAVGHACWIGDPGEAVVVLPGTRPPAVFSAEGVIPRVPRAPLGRG